MKAFGNQRSAPAAESAADDAPSTPGDASSARVGVLYRSEGQRLLAALPQSGAEIGKALGASRASVSAWRLGQKVPSPDAQRALAAAFPSVPVRAWSQRASSPEQAAPPRLELSGESDAGLATLDWLIADARSKIEGSDLTLSERSKLSAALARLIDQRRRMVEEEEGLEDRFLRSIDGRRFIAAIVAALRPYPEAARAVAAALGDAPE